MDGHGRRATTKECGSLEVLMCGYLPGASPERSPIMSPVPVLRRGDSSWTEACGGGCGFAMAISGSGKLITWGSVEDEGQSYLTSGKHGETPEPYPLPTEASIVKAAAGWAHCVAVTETGEVYTWGWRECIPSAKIACDLVSIGCFQKDALIIQKQGSPRSQGSKLTAGAVSNLDGKNGGDELVKRRKMASVKQEPESQYPALNFSLLHLVSLLWVLE